MFVKLKPDCIDWLFLKNGDIFPRNPKVEHKHCGVSPSTEKRP